MKINLPKFTPWLPSQKKPSPKVESPKAIFTPIEELPGIRDPIVQREFRGVNTLDPYSITDVFATDMSNLTSDDYPALTTRPGFSVLETAIGNKVLGLGVWKDTELHAVFNDGTWCKWTGSAWSTLASGLSTTAEWSFTNFQGNLEDINLIGSNGVDQIKRYDGSTVQNLANAPAKGNYITTYQNRLWCAFGMEIRACSVDNPTDWSTFDLEDGSSFGKTMESTRGENINMLSGSLSKLTIGMPNSLHELYGDVPSNFNTRLVTEDFGLANNRSAITFDGVMKFIHNTGIYEFFGGVLPEQDFSLIIQKYLSNIHDAVAGADSDRMYFYLGDRILVYDPRVPAWSVWDGFKPVCFAAMKNDLYIGDNTGRVLKLGGDTDAGNPIPWHWVSKPFTSQSMAQKIRWYKLWIVVDLEPGSALKVFLSRSAEGEDWKEVTASMQGRRVIIPIDQFANENMIRLKLSGTGKMKLHEVTRQYREMPLH